ncbi:DUF6232 family protein [Streptomyces sp. SBR177]
MLESRDKKRVLAVAVRHRTLWMGSTAMPLSNISVVDAFTVKPHVGAALFRVVKWVFLALVALVVIGLAADNGGGRDGAVDLGGPGPVLVLLVVAAVAGQELFAKAKPVLAVETAGGTLSVVTLPNLDELREVAGQIVHAIDHPEAEFTRYVFQYESKTSHYYGSTAIVSGQGNTGFKGLEL